MNDEELEILANEPNLTMFVFTEDPLPGDWPGFCDTNECEPAQWLCPSDPYTYTCP